MEQGVSISREWIHRYAYPDKRSGLELYRFLRCQQVRRKRKGACSRSTIARPLSISSHRSTAGNRQGPGIGSVLQYVNSVFSAVGCFTGKNSSPTAIRCVVDASASLIRLLCGKCCQLLIAKPGNRMGCNRA